jgi:hypothetical protein
MMLPSGEAGNTRSTVRPARERTGEHDHPFANARCRLGGRNVPAIARE